MGGTGAVQGYELLAPLAAAGDVSVHKARELSSGRECALSVLSSAESPTPEEEERQLRFLDESKLLLGFTHPNVLLTYDVGSAETCAWLANELVEGVNLQEVLDRVDGPLSSECTLALGIQIGRALGALSMADIVHRDLQPANIIITEDGAARLAGFGLKFESSYDRLSTGLAPLGSVDYLSPEQVEGDLPPSPRADVYGLGATLYRCLAGRFPHSGTTLFARLRSIAHDTYPDLRELNPEVDQALAEMIGRFLEWDADDRPLPQDTAVFLEQVAGHLGLQEKGWGQNALAKLVEEVTAAAEAEATARAEIPLVVRLRGTDRTIDTVMAVGEHIEVGRAPDVHVSLPRFGWISRKHARIERHPEGFLLTDLASANGTSHNKKRIKSSVSLTSGDLVAFGKSSFEVSFLESGTATLSHRQCALCGIDLSDEPLDEEDELGEINELCLRCQARADADREAAEHRIRMALTEARFEVLSPLGGEGTFKRYRVRRRKKTFIASAIELGQRTANLFAEGSKRALELKHTTVLPTMDLQVRSGILIVLSQNHPGTTLASLVREEGPLPAEETAGLGQLLCDGLHYLLEEGVKHTLVTPDLVLMHEGEPQLLDVGLAPGLIDASRARMGIGPRPCYSAPEVEDVRAMSPEATVYSLGATLSFALTSNPVSEIRGGERFDHLPLTMVPSIPSTIASLLSKATAPEPSDRQASPSVLRDALAAVILEESDSDLTESDDELIDEQERTTRMSVQDLPPEIFLLDSSDDDESGQ